MGIADYNSAEYEDQRMRDRSSQTPPLLSERSERFGGDGRTEARMRRVRPRGGILPFCVGLGLGVALGPAKADAHAREEYLTAFRHKPSHDVAGNLGTLEAALGLYRDAAEHIELALRIYAPSGTTPAQLAVTRELFATAKTHVGEVSITSNVEGAEILVDGVSVGRAPLACPVYVEPGEHVVEGRLAGYENGKKSVTAAKGSSQAVAFELVATVAVVVPKTGPGQPKVVPPPVVENGPQRGIIIAGAVGAAVGVVVGAVLAGLASGQASDADEKMGALRSRGLSDPCATRSAECDDVTGARESRDTLATASLGTFVGAGVLVAATLGYAFWPRAKTAPMSSSPLRVAPVVGGERGGLVVIGNF